MGVVDQWKLNVYGEAVASDGLFVQEAIDPFGILSRGLLWQGPNIFVDDNAVDGVSTSWSDVAALSTSWSDVAAVSTTWTDETFGLYGEWDDSI